MTANPSIDPARFLHEELAQADERGRCSPAWQHLRSLLR